MIKICRVDGCSIEIPIKRTMCGAHRHRWAKYGSYDEPKRFPDGIVKNCHIHGYLPRDKCTTRGTKRNDFRCKECVKQKTKNYNSRIGRDIKKKAPTDWFERTVVKTCSQHGDIGPNEVIYINDDNIRCKVCVREQARKTWKKHRLVNIARNRALKLKNDGYKESSRNSYLKRVYGITLIEYEIMHKKQNGLCMICSEPERVVCRKANKTRALAVDHKHGTKKVRGLLCASCNCMIGHAKDSINILMSAIEYLRVNEDGSSESKPTNPRYST